MKRQLLGMSVAAAMLLASSSAFAAGVNLRWNNCFGEGTGLANKNFACASNAGTNVLVSSFVPNVDMTLVSGNELVIDFLSQSATYPDWWAMKDPGTCRQLSLAFNTTANAGDVVCVDWAGGASAGGVGAYDTKLGSIDPGLSAQHHRMVIALAVPLAALADLVAGTEYFSCNITVNNAKTVGGCAGCTTPMCIVLNSIKVTTNTPGGAGDITIGGRAGIDTDNNIITWQGTGPDCLLVPTKNVTWGSVKALYR